MSEITANDKIVGVPSATADNYIATGVVIDEEAHTKIEPVEPTRKDYHVREPDDTTQKGDLCGCIEFLFSCTCCLLCKSAKMLFTFLCCCCCCLTIGVPIAVLWPYNPSINYRVCKIIFPM